MRQLMHSFRGFAAPDAVLQAVERGEITAFCLFRYNVQSIVQVAALTESLRRAAERGGHLPPIIGIDQEGGQLIAICEGATELPGNMALGATRCAHLAEQAGEVLGRELLAMGVNLDFAPSLDVNVNPANIAMGTRAFGDDPQLVAELGTALIQGMQRVGVIATAKHFPGLGDTTVDSHYEIPVVPYDLERLNTIELAPFRAVIQAADVASIMVGHVLSTSLDNQHVASVSPAIVNFLRKDLGYTGLVMTDAMDMHAVSRLGHRASVEAALRAGIDLVLMGHLPDQLALSAQLRSMEDQRAIRRIQAAQATIPRAQPSLNVVGCVEHLRIAQEIADRSITLVRDNGRLPLHLPPEATIAVITPYPENLTPADTSADSAIDLAQAIQKRHPNVVSRQIHRGAAEREVQEIVETALSADIVIVGTISANHDAAQAVLVNTLHMRGKAPIVVALRTPYDLGKFPAVETYLCAYSIRPVSVEAVARVLFGEIAPTGTLPCRIPNL